jgi:dolichol kinase
MIFNLPFFIFLITVISIFLVGEFALKYLHLKAESTRKFSHFLSGITVFLMPAYLNLTQGVILGTSFAVVLLIVESFKLLPSITRIERYSLGSFLFPLGLVISGLLFWNKDINAFRFSVLILAISDSAAGIIGYKFGKRKFLTGTVEGSFAFVLSTLCICLVFGLSLNKISLLYIVYYLVVATVLTATESLSSKGFDNLLLPPIAAFLISLAF